MRSPAAHWGAFTPSLEADFGVFESWVLFPGNFHASLGTELGGSQFGNPRCLHWPGKPHHVVRPRQSLPKSFSSQMARRCPIPGNAGGTCTRQSLSLSHTSHSLPGWEKSKKMGALASFPLYLPFPSPTFPDSTAKAVPMCKCSIICPGYVFIISDFNGVIQ